MIANLQILGLIGVCFGFTIVIPTTIGISLVLWQWAICRIRTAFQVEQAVMDYMRNKKSYMRWKEQQTDEKR